MFGYVLTLKRLYHVLDFSILRIAVIGQQNCQGKIEMSYFWQVRNVLIDDHRCQDRFAI